MDRLQLGRFLGVGLGLVVLFVVGGHPLAQSSASGKLSGRVTDAETGEPLVGVTVVATSPALEGQVAAITETGGRYFLDGLPPGIYTLSFYYGDTAVERRELLVRVGRTTAVDVGIRTSAMGESIVIEGRAPVIEATSTRTGATIVTDYSASIPSGRTFSSALGTAAKAAAGATGVSFAGSSSVESSYEIDQQMSARLLTAATVADCDRFDNYLDYLGRHQNERDVVGLAMDRRIRFSVRDARGKPVNDARIEIRGAGVVDGRTHADGIWDFFPSVDFGSGIGRASAVLTSGEHRESLAIEIPQRRDTREYRITVPEVTTEPAVLDLGFAIDVTGSMADELAYTNREIADIVARIRAAVPSVDLRVGAVVYRDRADAEPLRTIAFDPDVAAFGRALSEIEASGGGDYPEDVNAALERSMRSLEWREGNAVRVLVVLGDAPPKRYPGTTYDYRDAVREASARGIRFLPVAASGADREVEYLFRALGAYTSTPYVYLTDDSGIGNSHMEADTDRVAVEGFNDLLTRLVISDLLGTGMHEPEIEARDKGPWQLLAGHPRYMIAGVGVGGLVVRGETGSGVAPASRLRFGFARGPADFSFRLGLAPNAIDIDGDKGRGQSISLYSAGASFGWRFLEGAPVHPVGAVGIESILVTPSDAGAGLTFAATARAGLELTRDLYDGRLGLGLEAIAHLPFADTDAMPMDLSSMVSFGTYLDLHF